MANILDENLPVDTTPKKKQKATRKPTRVTRRLAGIPTPRGRGLDPEVIRFLNAVKEDLQSLGGLVGDPLDRAVTVRELVDADIAVTIDGMRRIAYNADITRGATAKEIINLPALAEGKGLKATDTYLGYYDGNSWMAYIDKDGRFFFGGATDANYIQWDGTVLTILGTIYATAGNIGGWVLAPDALYNLDSGSLLARDDGIVMEITSEFTETDPLIAVYSGSSMVAAMGNWANGEMGIYGISGEIAGWTIAATSLSKNNTTLSSTGVLTLGTGNDVVISSSVDGTYRIWVGHATAATATFSVTKAGAIFSSSGTIGGWTLSTTTLANSTDIILDASNKKISIVNAALESKGIQLAYNGGNPALYVGDGANEFLYFDGANLSWKGANSYLTSGGDFYATGGEIGGWTIAATTLTSANITIDSGNDKVLVNTITIDGANDRIQSANYVSGIAGAGFTLSPDLLEVGNIRVRGMIRTAVFQKDVISAVGGQLIVRPADVLASDMTALDASTLTIDGDETFAVNDILRIKDGTDDEWLLVTNIGAAPTYTVTRDQAGDYGADANPAWKKGSTVVNYGASGQGGLILTSGSAADGPPYVRVFSHAGAPWTTQTIYGQFGNLRDTYGYGANTVWGIGLGEYGAALTNVTVDSTNGLRIRLNTVDRMVVGTDGQIVIADEAGAELMRMGVNVDGAVDGIIFTAPGAVGAPDGANDVSFYGDYIRLDERDDVEWPWVILRRALSGPAAVTNGTNLGQISFLGAYDAAPHFTFAGNITVEASNNWDGIADSAYMRFHLSKGAGLIEAMRLTEDQYLQVKSRIYIGAIGTNPSVGLEVEGGAIFNETGADVDFRVESDGNANMLYVDGGTNAVGIGTVPSSLLHAASVSPIVIIQDTTNNAGAAATCFIGFYKTAAGALSRTGYIGDGFGGIEAIGVVADSGVPIFIAAGGLNPTTSANITMTASAIIINEGSVDMDIRVESNGNVNGLFFDGGNDEFGIGVVPTIKLDVNAKAGMSDEGGHLIKLTNRTGGNTVAGQLVRPDAGDDDSFATCTANDTRCIGIVYEAGVADDAEAWIVVGGIAEVLIDAGGCAHGDRMITSATAGSADVSNSPATATHFQEIGHSIETRVGAGLARCALHFL